MNRKHALGAAVAAAVVLTGAGCSKYTEQFKDAPKSKVRNDSPADVFNMPDGFSNGASKCDHGNRVYVLFHEDKAYGGIAVVPQDPTCAGR